MLENASILQLLSLRTFIMSNNIDCCDKLASILDKIDNDSTNSSEGKDSNATPDSIQPLPYGWCAYLESSTGMMYYHNFFLNPTQWEKPTVSVAPLMLQSEDAPSSSNLESCKAYFNSSTGRFSGTSTYWEKVDYFLKF